MVKKRLKLLGGYRLSQEHQQWMNKCLDLACRHVKENRGQPFAALVVKDGRQVGQGVNLVDTSGDPTAHAEIEAIRAACNELGTTDLSEGVIYASGEPCPMCMATIYWVGLKAVYIAYSKEDAARVGLGASTEIYRQLSLPPAERSIPMYRLSTGPEKDPFLLWQRMGG